MAEHGCLGATSGGTPMVLAMQWTELISNAGGQDYDVFFDFFSF